MIALVDMDGTLCDYRGALEKEIEDILQFKADIHDPKYEKLVDLIKRQDGFWRNLPVLETGMVVLNMLKAAGFQVHILTKGPHRTTSAWTEKVEWCRKYIPDIPVTVTESKKGMVYGRILFDDWPDYCRDWIKVRPRGLVLMPAYPYNESIALEYPNQILRVTPDNMDKVKEAILRAAKRNPGEEL